MYRMCIQLKYTEHTALSAAKYQNGTGRITYMTQSIMLKEKHMSDSGNTILGKMMQQSDFLSVCFSENFKMYILEAPLCNRI